MKEASIQYVRPPQQSSPWAKNSLIWYRLIISPSFRIQVPRLNKATHCWVPKITSSYSNLLSTQQDADDTRDECKKRADAWNSEVHLSKSRQYTPTKFLARPRRRVQRIQIIVAIFLGQRRFELLKNRASSLLLPHQIPTKRGKKSTAAKRINNKETRKSR